MSKQTVKNNLLRQGFLPIYVHDGFDSRALIDGAVEAGCTVLEYTCRRHDAREMIPWIKKNHPGVAVFGATLMDGERCSSFLKRKHAHFMTVDEMADLGVDGLVSFMRFLPETYEKYGSRLVTIPGIGTGNEAMEQLELGADFVKITTGRPAGEDLFMATRVGAHHMLPVMCSGGVTIERGQKFIEAGAVVCSAGYDLVLKDRMADPQSVDAALVRDRVKAYLDGFVEARKKHQPDVWAALEAGDENPMAAGPWLC